MTMTYSRASIFRKTERTLAAYSAIRARWNTFLKGPAYEARITRGFSTVSNSHCLLRGARRRELLIMAIHDGREINVCIENRSPQSESLSGQTVCRACHSARRERQASRNLRDFGHVQEIQARSRPLQSRNAASGLRCRAAHLFKALS